MKETVRKYGPYLAMAAIGLAVSVLAVIFPMPALDTFSRYAVMAEEFAAGNWKEAFHPRFGLGFSTVAGVLRILTGLDGYQCCCLAAALAWTLGMLAFYRLARQMFGETAGWFAIAIYAICPQPLVWVFKGFREAYRTAGLLMFVSAIVARGRNETSAGGFWEAAAALVCLCLFRNDAIIMALLLGLVYAVVDRFGRRTWGLAAWGALLLQLPCWLNYVWTGYWLPVFQGIVVLRKLGLGVAP